MFRTTPAANTFLLREGTDRKYGARHLKRAIERLLVHPLSNLIASDQINAGDWIELDFDDEGQKLRFAKIGEGLAAETMNRFIDNGMPTQAKAA